MNRKIGQYGGKLPGTLVLAFGALHGNEPAGVHALEEVFRILENEHSTHPGFVFRGKMVGFIGHLQAFEKKVRFLEKDLNRIWEPNFVEQLLQHKNDHSDGEAREIIEIYESIRAEIEAFPSHKIVLLDLHTTSAEGGIFSIPTDESESLALARELHVPVILRLQDSIEGPLLKFAAAGHFKTAPATVTAIAFEAGQHDDPLSVQRSVAAIICCLRATGCCHRHDLKSQYDALLRTSSAHLPPVVILRHVHHIQLQDQFHMKPGYLNFQKIRKGEHLADDIKGAIVSPIDGLILMPLYQPKGSDGFFIVQ